MRLFKLPQLTLPKWNFKMKVPKFLRSAHYFHSIWKRFIRQVPAETRPALKSYQHFIVIGSPRSGKTELIQGLVEQSNDIYPFESSYTQKKEIQFYLGPRQIIQEISFATIEDRSIKIRKQIIKLWKKLYANKNPIIIITFDCASSLEDQANQFNQLARYIAGKLSLLAEIRKQSLNIRIVLTNFDKIEGYLEFARFLKQQNLSFQIPLSTDFESQSLEKHLSEFTKVHLSNMLGNLSPEEFRKILIFAKKMPSIFPVVEDFLRAMVAVVSFKQSVKLEFISFSSKSETSTSFAPFEWSKVPQTALFFRYPFLKHQIAAALLFLFTSGLLFQSYFSQKKELNFAKRGISQMDLLQFDQFYQMTKNNVFAAGDSNLARYKLDFFGRKIREKKNELAVRIRKHFIEKEFRKSILEHNSELSYIYFASLMHATNSNRIGKFIIKNVNSYGKATGLDPGLVHNYVHFCQKIDSQVPEIHLTKSNPFIPLTSLKPWHQFLKQFYALFQQPVFIEHSFETILNETQKLTAAIQRLRQDPTAFALATILEQEYPQSYYGENIRVIRWIGENIDALESFLNLIEKTTLGIGDVHNMNVSQFFVELKNIAALGQLENQTFNFSINDEIFHFESADWVNLIVAHNVEQAMQNYIVLNTNSGGAIFFNNTSPTPEPPLPYFSEAFPHFHHKPSIPGMYSRVDFEKKVRTTTEKLSHLIDTLPINPEEKKRFDQFMVKEVTQYIKNYQQVFTKFFLSCEFQKVPLGRFKKDLKEMVKGSSSFIDFLRTIHYHTSGFSEPLLFLQEIKELNEFVFLDELLLEEDGVSGFDDYKAIINDLVVDLESVPSDLTSDYAVLESHLNTTAKLSLNILQNHPDSYRNRVKQFLNSKNIPSKFHAPFLQPIEALYTMGLKDLKKTIHTIYTTKLLPQVKSTLNKFPFNPNSEKLAMLDEVTNLFSPDGKLFQQIKLIISSGCYESDHGWTSLDPQNFQLDSQVLDTVNHIAKISRLLWDKQGNPQPLHVRAKSIPFVDTYETNPVPVLSYLIIGEESFHNFNQDPTWQDINLVWWQSSNSSVGMELISKYSRSKSYRNIQKLNSMWSFFELLKLAKQEDNTTWTWGLSNKEGKDERKISLCFEKNPLSIFEYKK